MYSKTIKGWALDGEAKGWCAGYDDGWRDAIEEA
jgi:hypothetical protein